jgi:hypothetical protein
MFRVPILYDSLFNKPSYDEKIIIKCASCLTKLSFRINTYSYYFAKITNLKFIPEESCPECRIKLKNEMVSYFDSNLMELYNGLNKILENGTQMYYDLD